MRGVRRFVEDLLGQRRPRPFRARPGDEDELRAAIMLRAAHEESATPSEEFVTGLHERLARQIAAADSPGERPQSTGSPGNRRRFVRTASVAAAAAAVGVGVDRLVGLPGNANPVQADKPTEPTLRANVGQWQAVAASTDLPDGAVRAFDLGSVMGFVQRSGGRLRAVSGVCTHLGCRLALDAPVKVLRCPCHTASFALSGEVLHHELPISLPPLPMLPVREQAGAVEVYGPPNSPA